MIGNGAADFSNDWKNRVANESPGLYVGTSGWSYEHWRGRFYPEDMPERDWFDFYTRRFGTVELNVTFYRLPFENMIKSWRTRAPKGFLFAVKGWRVITHRKRLRGVREEMDRFLERMGGLGDHLGPILWQLPPSLSCDLKLLRRFLKILPAGRRHALEFRHPSWCVREVYDVAAEFGAAIVGVSSLRMPPVCVATAPFVYLRFHGLAGGFAHDYTREELRPWAEWAAACLKEGRDVFAYFNNDANARAPENARLFTQMIRRR